VPVPRPEQTGAAHVFVEDLAAPELEADDAHHLQRVLRLRPGELVTASDGRGRWCRCRYDAGGGLELDGPIVPEPAPQPAITVAFAPVKGDRPEWTVQKLTELGVDHIVVLVAARSVVRWDAERAPRQLARLAKVAREAAMQSRRVRLPQVGPLQSVAEAASTLGAGRGAAVLAQPGGDPPSLDRPSVLIGPEGGWAEEELALGLPNLSLGPTVLRAETAALGAAMVLTALRAGIVRSARPVMSGDSAYPRSVESA
jgi:16S rRNA (uracil1498-N3)-methyltransferase